MKVREDTLKILVNNLSLRDYAYVTKDISNLEIEIERLNNIINELKEKNNLAQNILYDYLYKDKKITEEEYYIFKGLKEGK